MRTALARAAAAAWPGVVAYAESAPRIVPQNITGAGSTFAAPVYQKWAELQANITGVSLNYQAVGSGAGQKLVFDHTVDFGASDGPVTAARLEKAALLQFPTVIGAEDVVINLPGVAANQVRLTGKLIAGIYLGNITAWNDKAIAAVNPGLALPATPIAPVYRADGSGTTYVFTSYLSGIDPSFKDTVGSGNAVSWPAGTGAKGNAGVAGTVKSTVGAIGYVESAYAALNHLTTTQLQSRDGTFLKPSPETFAAAAAAANWADAPHFTVDMNNAPGPRSWPIVSTTYVLLPLHPSDPAKSAAAIRFFDWAFDHGDAAARGLQYVALPAAVKDRVREAWKTVQ
jgi:phosphate transport system substrate-binding protein